MGGREWSLRAREMELVEKPSIAREGTHDECVRRIALVHVRGPIVPHRAPLVNRRLTTDAVWYHPYAMKKSVKKQYQVRMDDDLKRLVLQYQEKMRKDTNVEASYADAARALIRFGAKAVGLR
jgi:hypothetical protein